jgi:hypothetical protein
MSSPINNKNNEPLPLNTDDNFIPDDSEPETDTSTEPIVEPSLDKDSDLDSNTDNDSISPDDDTQEVADTPLYEVKDEPKKRKRGSVSKKSRCKKYKIAHNMFLKVNKTYKKLFYIIASDKTKKNHSGRIFNGGKNSKNRKNKL